MPDSAVFKPMIPFSIEEFFGVFEAYNLAIYPAQFIAYGIGVVAVCLGIQGGQYSGRIILTLLAMFWGWVGLAYHIVYFTAINQASYIFGAFFILQTILLLYAGFGPNRFTIRFGPAIESITGAVLILYAMVIYPILNYAFGHTYPRMPVFGVAPCPVTIFTFGMFLWIREKVPLYIVAIPFLWSLVGASAAINLTVAEDYGLVVAGVVGSILIVATNRGKIEAT